jgi:energy-coupling factor transporter ATP-binding protein EcfA2
MSTPAVLLENLRFAYPAAHANEQAVEVLQNLTLKVPAGQSLAILGGTGSGKTTLALILAGLVPEMTGGSLHGQAQVDGLDATKTPAAQLSAHLGLVFQEPERQLFNMTVADEVAFSLEGLATPPQVIQKRISWVLERVGLAGLADRAPWQLSGGQQKRLAIASILVLRPPILLLDEPMAGLDPLGRREVAALLKEIQAETGATVIVLEKDAEFVARWAERVVVLTEGRLGLDGPPGEVFRQVDRLQSLGIGSPQIAELAARLRAGGEDVAFLTAQEAAATLRPRLSERAARLPGAEASTHDGDPSLRVSMDQGQPRLSAPVPSATAASPLAVDGRELSFTYPGGAHALRTLSLAVPAGQFLALVGPNGGGKSTLARHLNGLLRPQHGSVAIQGRPIARRPVGELAREVGYVFQNPDHQIFAATVREEISFGLRNLGLREDELKRQVEAALAAFDLEALAETPPAVLGYGLRRLVTVASVWAMRPPIWILDEPTTGLDDHFSSVLAKHMRTLHQAGHTILLITHDLRLAAAIAERIAVVSQGQIALDGPPSTVMRDAQALAAFGLRPPPITRLSAALAPHGFSHPMLTMKQFVVEWNRVTG